MSFFIPLRWYNNIVFMQKLIQRNVESLRRTMEKSHDSLGVSYADSTDDSKKRNVEEYMRYRSERRGASRMAQE